MANAQALRGLGRAIDYRRHQEITKIGRWFCLCFCSDDYFELSDNSKPGTSIPSTGLIFFCDGCITAKRCRHQSRRQSKNALSTRPRADRAKVPKSRSSFLTFDVWPKRVQT